MLSIQRLTDIMHDESTRSDPQWWMTLNNSHCLQCSIWMAPQYLQYSGRTLLCHDNKYCCDSKGATSRCLHEVHCACRTWDIYGLVRHSQRCATKGVLTVAKHNCYNGSVFELYWCSISPCVLPHGRNDNHVRDDRCCAGNTVYCVQCQYIVRCYIRGTHIWNVSWAWRL